KPGAPRLRAMPPRPVARTRQVAAAVASPFTLPLDEAFMWIDIAHFTPGTAAAGGLLLGLATVVYLTLNGRIAGVSGLLAGLMQPPSRETGWRVAFLLGLVAAPWMWSMWMPLPPARIEAGTGLLIAAGLMIGWGARQASGCTSGHAVSGLARRSLRSLMSTALFLVGAFVTVAVMRHLVGA
ncbi:YeeE/YedE family protein, partial [Piscinibacter sp.]|uniref:YeeE/YedE family protein n=1 Tax=Piscinibacter sp. TaxID=1903157 RepID=UPI002C85CD65